MRAEEGRQRSVEETRAAAALVEHLRARGCQPSPLLAAMGSARVPLRLPLGVRARALRNAQVAAGVSSDGRGRWAVDVILEWRGGSANRMAHVRWLGFDPRTGLPWLDSWEPRGNLTHDLRAGGLTRQSGRGTRAGTSWARGTRGAAGGAKRVETRACDASAHVSPD